MYAKAGHAGGGGSGKCADWGSEWGGVAAVAKRWADRVPVAARRRHAPPQVASGGLRRPRRPRPAG
ncbi:hypothetical protein CBM2633_A90118 [Cupriavidus taiwanensis]|nr:hypothetical protein CBM2633_A90118 [Cupriavidus taiwanensis]